MLDNQDILELLAALDVVVRAQGLTAVFTVAKLQARLNSMLQPPDTE